MVPADRFSVQADFQNTEARLASPSRKANMNRNLSFLAGLLLVSGMAMGQAQQTPSNTDVRGAAGGAASQTDQSTQQVLNKQAAGQTAATPARPAGGTKTAPEPKTKEEEAAMKAVIAKASDPAAMEAAANDFSAKFPDSNVRGMLYRQLMLVYEQQGNADKSYEMGRKSLTFDPDDPSLSPTARSISRDTPATATSIRMSVSPKPRRWPMIRWRTSTSFA